jgi:general secretion pathway protein J
MPGPRPVPSTAGLAPMRRPSGFTLVEVLVALFIMSVLALLAWRGVDGLLRTRDGTRDSTQAVLRISTAMAQWQEDLNHVQDTPAAPSLRFDGAALRLTRRSPEGMQFVVWTRQGQQLWRWASPPVTRVQDLQDWWLRGMQWSAISTDALAMLDGVSDMQVYYWRNADNTWSNAQSSGDVAEAAAAAASAASSAASSPDASFDRLALPRGVRLQLTLPGGQLTRDIALQ